jgi:predicted nucleotidyltransferase
MRIDPKTTIAGLPALQMRLALKRLSFHDQWDANQLETAAGVAAGTGRSVAKALVEAGLANRVGTGFWTITQAGQRMSSATAAQPVTRATAERALNEFLVRVDDVNRREGFLGKVVAVVLFGSMLNPEVDRLSDVDVAVEIAPKLTDESKLREANDRRVQLLARQGHRFRTFLEVQFYWYYEAFRYLKGGSRVIALADLRSEGELILAVPHRVILGNPSCKPQQPAPQQARPRRRRVKPDPDCPF